MRKHIRLLKKGKPITVRIRRLESKQIKPASDRYIGQGSLYSGHLQGAIQVSDDRENRHKKGTSQYYEASTMEDDARVLLTEKETIAAMQAYSMEKELRPFVKDHQRKMKVKGNDGKYITVGLLNDLDEYDNATINEYVKLLVEFEDWQYYPKGTTLQKLRTRQRFT